MVALFWRVKTMREILFRGKRKGKKGNWVEGYYVLDESGQIKEKPITFIYHLNTHPCGFDVVPCEVIPETVGQYTGLCDKNGKKIFEGDILKYKERNTYQADMIIHRDVKIHHVVEDCQRSILPKKRQLLCGTEEKG
jgi:uncharacterized phage protein (TIGR01671 family)